MTVRAPRGWPGLALLAAGLLLLAPWRLVDPDELARLAMARELATQDPRMTLLARRLARTGARAWPPPGEPGRFTLYRIPLTSRGR